MKVRVQRSGGLGGPIRSGSLDTEALDAAQKGQVEDALARVDLGELAGRPPSPARGADRFQYALTVEDQGERHELLLNEPDVPEELRPVLDIVLAHEQR